MAAKGTLVWLCSLAVLVMSSANESLLQGCSDTQLYERLSKDLKGAIACRENIPTGFNSSQIAQLMKSMRTLTDILHTHQAGGCQGEPVNCTQPKLPANGGLVCATVDNKRYCKPMCNHGYDFGFMRRSRVFDVCSLKNKEFRWDTQYVGGNTLAVCNESPVQVAGTRSAYFPQGQDCLTTKSDGQSEHSVISAFEADLRAAEIEGDILYTCLSCGAGGK